MSEYEGDSEGFGPDVIVIDREKEAELPMKEPKQHKVIIMNDDYSEWGFVVEVLMTIFGQGEDQANRTTQTIHKTGKGLAGTYTKDIAETKAQTMNDFAQSNGFPLHAETEELE